MKSGDVVAERFEIERLAGSGGMGAVYKAKDRLTGEAVALKTLRTDAGDFSKRFLREARVLLELKHPAIVRYIAHGVTPGGELYLAMEWLVGQDLYARLKTSGITMGETFALLGRAAEALGAAHARGVVHRDIKPGNLFLVGDEAQKLKILDFGIAHQPGFTRIATRTGAMLGTPGYMAPEQARGDREIDARVDIFALGCVTFKCLVGRVPFAGDDVLAVAAKLLFEEAPRVDELRPDVPKSLADLVARMLSKNRERRPENGTALAAELESQDTVAIHSDAEAPTNRGAPSAITSTEQRLVSVVLASGTAVDAGPEAATIDDSRAAATWKQLTHAVAPYGAHLERLIDGTIVATLSGKGSATDQAGHAARCALAIRALLPRGTVALATGMGVLAGKLPFGDAIDRAVGMVRAEDTEGTLEGPPPVEVDELTAGLLDARFDVGATPPRFVLRGERDPLETARTLLGRPVPCVGRERELGMLEVALTECFSEPIARAVVVVAGPGVGKSRLLHEFIRRVHQRGLGAAAWVSRGDPMSAGSPFGMLAQLLRRAIGIREGEPERVRKDKLAARIERSVAATDAPRVRAFLAELTGTPLDDTDDVQLRAARANPVLMGDQMQRAWEDFLAAECAQKPILLVLEDLHWGDLPTVRFIDSALRNLHESPLFVLALGRPELTSLFPSLWVERSPTEVRLGELSRKASERLVREALGADAKPETVARIVDRAAGNAFYLEELIRAVADGKSDLPETVLAMVQARLEDLEPEARRVLRAASIFGQAFWIGGTVVLLGGEEETSEVGEWLRVLAERELVTRRGEGKFPGQLEFVFRHALVRDAAYASFTDQDRALGHRLAGGWLERAGESDALVLAEHFERGGDRGRAAASYLRAAEQALEGNDFDAAVARAEQGIACGAHDETFGLFMLRIAEAKRWAGRNQAAERAAEEALRALPPASPLAYRAATQLVHACAYLEHHARLYELSEELLGAPDENDEKARALIEPLCVAATQVLYSGRFDLAEALLVRVEALAARAGTDPAVNLLVLRAKGARAAISGDLAESLRLKRLSVMAGVEAGDVRNTCLERVNFGHCLTELGAHQEAEKEIREALQSAERLGLKMVVALAKNNLGLALARRGALDLAIEAERDASVMFAAQNHRRMESSCRAYLGFMLAEANDLPAAEREAETALQIVSAAIDRPYVLSSRSRVRGALGRTKEALEDAEEAVRLLDELGALDEGEVLVRLVYAEALHAAGELDKARTAIATAQEHLLAMVGKIGDGALRAQCLANVPENMRTLELAAEWGAG